MIWIRSIILFQLWYSLILPKFNIFFLFFTIFFVLFFVIRKKENQFSKNVYKFTNLVLILYIFFTLQGFGVASLLCYCLSFCFVVIFVPVWVTRPGYGSYYYYYYGKSLKKMFPIFLCSWFVCFLSFRCSCYNSFQNPLRILLQLLLLLQVNIGSLLFNICFVVHIHF